MLRNVKYVKLDGDARAPPTIRVILATQKLISSILSTHFSIQTSAVDKLFSLNNNF
jgi:hypothetical protein